jgi:hypothetical protein
MGQSHLVAIQKLMCRPPVILRGTERSEVEAQNPIVLFSYLLLFLETATPHRVSLRETVLSRTGRGKEENSNSF